MLTKFVATSFNLIEIFPLTWFVKLHKIIYLTDISLDQSNKKMKII